MSKKIIAICVIGILANFTIGCDNKFFSSSSSQSISSNENVATSASNSSNTDTTTSSITSSSSKVEENKNANTEVNDNSNTDDGINLISTAIPQNAVVTEDSKDGSRKRYIYEDAVTITINRVETSETTTENLAMNERWQLGELIYNDELTKKFSYTVNDFSYMLGSNDKSQSGRGILISDVNGYDYVLDVSVYNDKYSTYNDLINSIINKATLQ